jgi:hypothetical protein
MVGTRGLAATVALSAALLSAGASASAATGTEASDRAATLAYLRAEIADTQANLEALPAAVLAVRAQAARLQGECPAVLAGAPPGSPVGPGPGPNQPSARAQGEATRSGRQLGYLQLEFRQELFAPLAQAELSHVASFAAAVLPLRWSDPRFAAAVQAQVRDAEFAEGPLQVCADMRFWAASGYKEVSPATRAFVAAENERFRIYLEPVELELARYEQTPAAKAALRALKRLRERVAGVEASRHSLAQSLSRALGLHPFEPPPRPRVQAILVGRGRTAAGQRWTAHLHRGTGCTFEVEVESRNGEGAGSEGWCFSRHQTRAEPSVSCSGGLLAISSFTRPQTTLVRLRLSDGRSITSAPIRIPRRLGGPLGLYYQVVRGPSPIPRLITELDSSGRVLRITHLPAVVECTRNPIKYLGGSPKTVASGAVPGGGPRFSIVAERYRFLGKVYFDLVARVEEERHSLFGVLFGGSSHRFGFGPSPLRQALSIQEETGCEPHPYEILFGLLRDPGEVVSANSAVGTVPLAAVALPPSLHTRGVLVYGAFSPPPMSLSLRKRTGTTVGSEPLETKELVERCEGEAEPGGPIG